MNFTDEIRMGGGRRKIAGRFSDAEQAYAAADFIRDGIGPQSDVEILEPHENARESFSLKVEPGRGRVWRLLYRSHVILGIAGALLGMLAMIYVQADTAHVSVGYPLLLPLIGAFFGGIAGMLLAGLWSLVPGEGMFAARLADASSNGRWQVIVHTRNDLDQTHSYRILKRHAETILTS